MDFDIRLEPRFLHPLNAGYRAPSCVLPVAPANNAPSIRTLAGGWNELVCYARQPLTDRTHPTVFLINLS